MLPTLPFLGALEPFLLAFSALFSIVNPPGSALVFREVTGEYTHAERVALAGRIALYAALVMLAALWVGASVLGFFGVTLAALRIAGGLVVAVRAWELLDAPEDRQARKQEDAAPAASREAGRDIGAVAFFPLTLPFTTGPGTISVAIALGANRPAEGPALAAFAAGVSAAALAVALLVWVAYGASDRVVGWIGPAGTRVVSRLMAFLLLCIGIQITLSGVLDALRPLLAARTG